MNYFDLNNCKEGGANTGPESCLNHPDALPRAGMVSQQSQVSAAVASGGQSDNLNRPSLSAFRDSSSSAQQYNNPGQGYFQEGYGGNPISGGNQAFHGRQI